MAALVPDLPQVEQHIVEMTNQVRQEQKLPALKINAMLAKAARAFARNVAKSGKFSHTADGRTPAQRAESAGYKHCEIAENLAMDQDSRGFDTGDSGAPGHRRLDELAAASRQHTEGFGIGDRWWASRAHPARSPSSSPSNSSVNRPRDH